MPETVDYFDLDKHRLDEEWVLQVRAYRQLAGVMADRRADHERAKAAKDVAEADLKLAQARLDRAIRQDPTAYGFPEGKTPTEGAIASTILTQRKYRDALAAVHAAAQAIIVAKHALDNAEAEVRAMDHRKEALGDLVKLYLASYFARPRDPDRAAGEAAADRAFGPRRPRRA